MPWTGSKTYRRRRNVTASIFRLARSTKGLSAPTLDRTLFRNLRNISIDFPIRTASWYSRFGSSTPCEHLTCYSLFWGTDHTLKGVPRFSETHIHTYIYTYTHVHVYVCMCMCACACVCVCVCVCVCDYVRCWPIASKVEEKQYRCVTKKRRTWLETSENKQCLLCHGLPYRTLNRSHYCNSPDIHRLYSVRVYSRLPVVGY